MKKINFTTLTALVAVICTLVLSSCSGSDMDLTTREKPTVNNTPGVETSLQHNWIEEENKFSDNAISNIKYVENGVKETSFSLPASIEWSVEEVLRTDTTFSSTEKNIGTEKKEMVKATQDSTIFAHLRNREENFAETTINMTTIWKDGVMVVNGKEASLAYVRLDSIVSFPNLTKVEKIGENEEIRRYSFSMPHKAYYTAVSTRGNERIIKDFNVNGTFLYKEDANNNDEPSTPETKTLVDAKFINRYFNNDEQKSYMTLNCVWSDGSKDEMTFWVSLPYGWSFPEEWSTNVTTEGPSKFVKLTQDSNPSKGSYTETSETNAAEYGKVLRRKVSKKTSFVFTDFTEELNSYHHEAYISINGKDFQFLSPEESISQGTHGQNVSKEGKTSTEKNTVKANIKFNQANFHESGIVNVIRIEDANNEEPVTTIPSEYGDITGVMGVTRVCEMSSKTPIWHTCVTIRTNKGQIRIVDETNISFMSFDEIYDDSRMVSGAYKNGTLYPALINIDNSGWTYVAETKTGISFAVEMSDQLAISSGIKNFAKNNSAKPTPIVDYTSSTKNGILTVTYKINGAAKVVTVK